MLSQASQELKQRFMQEFSKEILIQISKNFPKEIEKRNIVNIIQNIESILKEEGVQAIECPAPDRYLIIKKHSKLKVLNLMLEEDEIQQIISFFFKKAAKQPSQTFSLKLAQVVVSGLLSPKIGSRFIIVKKKIHK